MVLSGTSMYVGASVGVLLFDAFPPAAVAWLRVAVSALVIVALVRPRKAAWRGRRLLLAAGFGVVTALMNICFYESIARLPLGTAVAIEFLGPIAVVAYASRSARGVASLVAAGAGVAFIADVQFAGEPLGVAFALLAAAFWAGYVVLGKVVAGTTDSMSSLAVGWTVAAVVTSPLLISVLHQDTRSESLVRVASMVLALAVLSSVIPYLLDQQVLRMVGRGRFALLLALLPVAAVGAGFLMLRQVPSRVELIGIALVIGALIVSERPAQTVPLRPADRTGGGPA
ncbi:EamA family transporter [Mycolicibacterium sp. S2-37]|uniref:EamA family transporter n=1 Tax=Mycolicibacterium sp. S2-37 TaxID=2810297 RepID=UPI001A946352|nr:EamA family transporter [Mycolicibacterium sp. S2-37]MBO0678351.1 EamA family transporter [Mycolicibacterium sp. S2-37]